MDSESDSASESESSADEDIKKQTEVKKKRKIEKDGETEQEKEATKVKYVFQQNLLHIRLPLFRVSFRLKFITPRHYSH